MALIFDMQSLPIKELCGSSPEVAMLVHTQPPSAGFILKTHTNILCLALLLVLAVQANGDEPLDVNFVLDGQDKTSTLSKGQTKYLSNVRDREPIANLVECSELQAVVPEPPDGCAIGLICNGGHRTCRVANGNRLSACSDEPLQLRPCKTDDLPKKSDPSSSSEKNWGTFGTVGGVKRKAEISPNKHERTLTYVGTSTRAFNLPCKKLPGRAGVDKGKDGCSSKVYCDTEDGPGRYCRILKIGNKNFVKHWGAKPIPGLLECEWGFKNVKAQPKPQNQLLEFPPSQHDDTIPNVSSDEGPIEAHEGDLYYLTELVGDGLYEADAILQISSGATNGLIVPHNANGEWLRPQCADLPHQPPQETVSGIQCFTSVVGWECDSLVNYGCRMAGPSLHELSLSQCGIIPIPGLDVCNLASLGF